MNSSIIKLINLDEKSPIPKYIQLANEIADCIKNRQISENEILPSINELNFHFDISRGTAEKSYRYLLKKNIVSSVPGKGFFSKKESIRIRKTIFFLFDQLDSGEEHLYYSFAATIKNRFQLEIHVYNNNALLLKKMFNSRNYSYYILSPQIHLSDDEISTVFGKLSPAKLIFLGEYSPNGYKGLAFGKKIENGISYLLNTYDGITNKYRAVKVIFSGHSDFYERIIQGVKLYCERSGLSFSREKSPTGLAPFAGDIFFVLGEFELVEVIQKLNDYKLEIGSDVGIISYQDSPLKRIITNGITTIAMDYGQLGRMAAEFIIDGLSTNVHLPFYLTHRKSL